MNTTIPMKVRYILIVLSIIFTFSSQSQNLPYLNASTGNIGQSFTDADTNIYMFHGKRLEKLSKNLNVIWVNTYNNINFSNLLLSKTGSIFFIEVKAEETVIRKRLQEKRVDSEADFEVYKKVKKQWEPLNEDHLVLQSTDDNINEMLYKAADYLHLKDDKRTDK